MLLAKQTNRALGLAAVRQLSWQVELAWAWGVACVNTEFAHQASGTS